MPEKPYKTGRALRQALESRLNATVTNNAEVQRLRRLVSFDRLLARLFATQDSPWLVKGGYGLEVRYGMKARTTRDVDLALPSLTPEMVGAGTAIQSVWEKLQDDVSIDLGDYFVIYIGAPRQEFDAPPEGGARFPVEVHLDQRTFAKFHLDVGVGDIILNNIEWSSGEDFLAFASIPRARFRIIPIAQQLAEKVHSYTLPRASGFNSRVKDLIDLILILDHEVPAPESVKSAVEATFTHRKTHEIPLSIPAAPPSWAAPFASMAKELRLSRLTTEDAVARINSYWKTVF